MSDEQHEGPSGDGGPAGPTSVEGPVGEPSLPPEVERRAARWIGFALAVSMLAAIGLFVSYVLGNQVQVQGGLLALALGGIAMALIMWAKKLFVPEVVTEERGDHPAGERELEAVAAAAAPGGEAIARRPFLARMLGGAAGLLGLSVLLPVVRSLGPSPGRSLFTTDWSRGALLVDEFSRPLKASDLEIGSVATVFPQGFVGSESSMAIVLRVPQGLLNLPDGRDADAPDGVVCYSKLCTHAGCPVGLYEKLYYQLQCPCHFSAFDVLNGAEPVFGPAPRPLPQLPIEIDDAGYLRAKGGFTATPGPGFWNRGSGP